MKPYVQTIGYTKNGEIRHMSISFNEDPYKFQVHFKFNQFGYTNIKAPDRLTKLSWPTEKRLAAVEALKLAKIFVNKYFSERYKDKEEIKLPSVGISPKKLDILKFPRQLLMQARNSIF